MNNKPEKKQKKKIRCAASGIPQEDWTVPTTDCHIAGNGPGEIQQLGDQRPKGSSSIS